MNVRHARMSSIRIYFLSKNCRQNIYVCPLSYFLYINIYFITFCIQNRTEALFSSQQNFCTQSPILITSIFPQPKKRFLSSQSFWFSQASTFTCTLSYLVYTNCFNQHTFSLFCFIVLSFCKTIFSSRRYTVGNSDFLYPLIKRVCKVYALLLYFVRPRIRDVFLSCFGQKKNFILW